MTILLFIVGFLLLIKGAQFLVDGSSAIARKFGVSELVVGLTIVSFGTSLPELLVNVFASIEGNTQIAVGNILGSNIANILLILGVAALINKISVQKSTLYSEIPFALIAIFLLGFLTNADVFSPKNGLILSQLEGCILLFFFILFMLYIIAISRHDSEVEKVEDDGVNKTKKHAGLKIVLGLVGLYFGGVWVVEGAILIATSLGMSESFIGLTVIAVGTSLPELVTSAVAAYKGKGDIAIGNVVGSNIFNILWILGVSSLIKPLPFVKASNTDILVVVGSTVLLILCLLAGKGKVLKRWTGLVLLLSYIAYIGFLINRG